MPDIEQDVEQVCDLIVTRSLDHYGLVSPEKLRAIQQAIGAINLEEYASQFAARKKEEREARLSRPAKCPCCGNFDKIRVIDAHGACQSCHDAMVAKQSRSCIICGVTFLPRMAGRSVEICYEEGCQKIVTQISSQNARSSKHSTKGDLTLNQWLATIRYFDWKCAYCNGPFEVLEHFMPVSLNGVTTQSNCVPACYNCNALKRDNHPSLFHLIFPRENLTTIRSYLATLHTHARPDASSASC